MSQSQAVTVQTCQQVQPNKYAFVNAPWTLIKPDAPCSPLLRGLITLASTIVTLGISIIFMIVKACSKDADMSRRHVAQKTREENAAERNRLADTRTSDSGDVSRDTEPNAASSSTSTEVAAVNAADSTSTVVVTGSRAKNSAATFTEDADDKKTLSKTKQKKLARIAKRKAGQKERTAQRQAEQEKIQAAQVALMTQLSKQHKVHTVNGKVLEIDGQKCIDPNHAMYSAFLIKQDPACKTAESIKLTAPTPQSVLAFGALINQLKDKLDTKEIIVHIPALCADNFKRPNLANCIHDLNHPHLYKYGKRVTFTTDAEEETPLEKAINGLMSYQEKSWSLTSQLNKAKLEAMKTKAAQAKPAFVPKAEYTAAELLAPESDLLKKLSVHNQKMADSGGISFSISIDEGTHLEQLAKALKSAFVTPLPKEIKIQFGNELISSLGKFIDDIKYHFFAMKSFLSFATLCARHKNQALLEDLNNLKYESDHIKSIYELRTEYNKLCRATATCEDYYEDLIDKNFFPLLEELNEALKNRNAELSALRLKIKQLRQDNATKSA